MFLGVVEFPGVTRQVDRRAVPVLGHGGLVGVDETFHLGRLAGDPAGGLVGSSVLYGNEDGLVHAKPVKLPALGPHYFNCRDVGNVYDRAGTFEALSTTIGATGSEKNSAPITIVVTSSGAPIAQLSAGPSSGIAPLTVQFTGSVTDPEGDPLTFSWDFGDGSGLQASVVPSISHTFEDPGQFEVTLTAADDKGNISTVSVTIDVLSADDGGGGNGNGGLPDANANDNGAGQDEPDEPICGCGAVGSMQFMMILIGIFGLKYSRRRRG